jgi:hypothetical protein
MAMAMAIYALRYKLGRQALSREGTKRGHGHVQEQTVHIHSTQTISNTYNYDFPSPI